MVNSKDEKKVEEREKDEGGDRNKDGRSKADDENKALFGGHKVKTQRAYSVSKNNDGSHSYPLVDPRPEEAPDIDDSTVVQCTGTERSTVHPLDVMDNALYSQHQEDKKRDDVRSDSKAETSGDSRAGTNGSSDSKPTRTQAKKLAKDLNRPVDKTRLACTHPDSRNKEGIGTDKPRFGGLEEDMYGGF